MSEAIKVFLVEDEYAIREGIKKSVDWEKNGFELVGEAGDGEVAFPKIVKSKPDILITDIRMPFMDGLELSKLVKKELPDIKIVVLSGYDDFNYAKEAISIGVEEYILKPVSGDKLMEELGRIAELVKNKKQEMELRSKYIHDREEIRILEQQKFLHDVIGGKMSMGESLKLGKDLGIEITAAYYAIVLMQVFPKNIQSIDAEEYSSAKEDMYIKLNDIYSDKNHVYLYEQVGDVLCFLERADDEKEIHANIRAGIDDIKAMMEEYDDMMFFISVGKVVDRIRDVNSSYTDASKKFAERYMYTDSFVFYEETEGDKDGIRENVNEDRKQTASNLDINSLDVSMLSKKTVYHFLRNGTLSEVEDLVNEYFESMGSEAFESMMLRQYVLMESMLSAVAFLDDLGVNKEDISDMLGDLKNPVLFADSVDSAKQYIKDLLNCLIEHRNKVSDKKYVEIIDKAKDYIQENYKEDDMSLQSVASYVNVSSNHFSAIFRRETGETFIDYLTTVRMDKAKDLLVCTSMKTSDVGFEVGYRDPHYFSYIFKKTQGMSPKEFRRIKKES
ncbi:MAG: response regulator [Eubacterium sp.]|nr:response regulator [Eubacterium sp.]